MARTFVTSLTCDSATLIKAIEVVADEVTKGRCLKRRVVVAKESMAADLLGNGADVDEERDGRGVVDRDDREKS